MHIEQMISDALAERIELELLGVGSPDDYVVFSLSKDELRALSQDDLRFLSSYVRRYRRGSHALRPRSLWSFIADKRYEGDDEAVFEIRVSDLIQGGLLRKEEIQGLKYWVFRGKKLDPAEYMKLYRSDREMLETLASHHGYGEIYRAFSDRIIDHPPFGSIFAFTYMDAMFTLYPSYMVVERYVGYPPADEPVYYGPQPYPRPGHGSVRAVIKVSAPGLRDVERALDFLSYTDLLAREIIDNMADHIYRSSGISIDRSSFQGEITARNYRVEEIDISSWHRYESGRDILEINVKYRYPGHVYHIDIRGFIKSAYVYRLLTKLAGEIAGERLEMLPEEFWIATKRDDVMAGLAFSGSIHADNPPLLHRIFHIIEHRREILYELALRYLESISDKPIRFYDGVVWYTRNGESYTVGDILGIIRWGDIRDFDEAVLKIVAAKLMLITRPGEETVPPIIDYLVASAVLKGYPHDLLTEKVNRPLDTIARYIEKGYIRFIKGEGWFFKGRRLEDLVDISKPAMIRFEKALTSIYTLLSDQEELERLLPTPA